MISESKSSDKMENMSVTKLIVKMSSPPIFFMLIQSMYNNIDSYFVAKIGENALIAVSLISPLQLLVTSLAVGNGIGIVSLLSRKLGAKDTYEANQVILHGALIAILYSLIFLTIGLFLTRPFLNIFTNDYEILDIGSEYASIICIFSIGAMFQLLLEKIMQGYGNTFIPMVTETMGIVINIILDPIFIFGFNFIPAMGIKGAAIATVIGQLSSMIFLIIAFKYKVSEINLNIVNFKFSILTLKKLFAVSIPSTFMQVTSSVMMIFVNGLLIKFSETAVAVFGIYNKFKSIFFLPIDGLSSGVLPIMGYNYGAKSKKRLIKTLKISLIISVAIMTIGLLIFLIFTNQILALFSASDNMIEIGIPALRILSLSLPLIGFGMIFSTFFQALGKGIISLLISVLRKLLLLIPIAYFLSNLGLTAVWYSFPISEFIAVFIGFICLFVTYKKTIIKL